jgi:hypothetical protein
MRRYGGLFSLTFLLILLGFLLPAIGSAEISLTQNSPQFRYVAQDNQGNLHTLWVSEDGPASRLYYQAKAAFGKSLTDPVLLTESSTRIRRPKVAIDGRNMVHLLWQERVAKGAGRRVAQGTTIHYAKLSLTPSGAVVVLIRPSVLTNDQGRRHAAMHPSIAVDEAGWAYVIWEEGRRDVVLTAIDPSGKIEQTRQVSRRATETDHAEPAVAVDRRGNVHVVWTTQAGDKTQLVYKAFRGHGGKVLVKEKIVYAFKGSFAQAKVVRFDKQGNVKIAWANFPDRRSGQRARWAMSGSNAGSGYVVVRAGRSSTTNAGSVVAAADKSIQALPDRNWLLANDAVVNPKPRLNSPAQAAERIAVTDPPKISQSFSDPAVSKLLMEQVLRYSSWSAPPPSAGTHSFTNPLSEASSLSNTCLFLLKLNNSSNNSCVIARDEVPKLSEFASLRSQLRLSFARNDNATLNTFALDIADLSDCQTIQLIASTRGGET